MASLTSKGDYWRLSFYSARRSPKTKDLYYKKDDYTKSQIQETKKDLEYEFKHGKWNPWDHRQPSKDSITLKEAIELFERKEKRRLASDTLNNRMYSLEAILREYRDIDLATLPDNYWEEYVNEPDKYKSREMRRTVIYGLYKRLNKEGYDLPLNIELIGKNSEKKLRSIVTTQQWLTVKEMEDLIKAIPDLAEANCYYKNGKKKGQRIKHAYPQPAYWMEDIIRLAFYTGMRRADLFALRPGWIREDNKVVRIGGNYDPKSQLPEEIMPTLPEARPLLQKLKDEAKEDKPFFGEHRPDRASKKFKELVRFKFPNKAEHIWFHCLRHSFVMYCMDELKLRDRVIMHLTRHEDERSLRKYKHHNVDSVLNELDNL